MNGKLIAITFIKAAVFLVALLALSIVLKLIFPKSGLSSRPAETKQGDGRTFFFLGTSRTRASIEPAILEGELKDDNFTNLSASNCSFLYSCAIASNLLEGTPRKKVLFIEVTGLEILPPFDLYPLMSKTDVHEAMAQHLKVRRSSEDIVELMYYGMSIKEDLKRIFDPHVQIAGLNPGEPGRSRELKNGRPAIPTPERLENLSDVPPEVMTLYKNSINRLLMLAERTESEVIFLLPLAIPDEDELQIDIPVFSLLPEDNKWQYTNEFEQSMNSAKYFADVSHLNQTGARIYTLELLKFIRQRFGT